MEKFFKKQQYRQNCENLAKNVVDSWDMETLLAYAEEKLTEDYVNNKELFETDWMEFTEE